MLNLQPSQAKSTIPWLQEILTDFAVEMVPMEKEDTMKLPALYQDLDNMVHHVRVIVYIYICKLEIVLRLSVGLALYVCIIKLEKG